MSYDDFRFTAEDGQEIFVASWLPENSKDIKAVVQLAHGMAEHILRYGRFAEFLNKHGFAVYGNDHRGHGKTAGVMENVGYFADEDGFGKVVKDMVQLTIQIEEKHPDIPVFLFGHSMGSLLSRNYLLQNGEKLKGAILSGTMGDPGLLGKVGLMIAKMESKLKGRKHKSPLLDKLSFGKFNGAFKPNRTDFDWLSRDNDEVDKYVNDPYCGTVFSIRFFKDLINGLEFVNKKSHAQMLRNDLPMYLFSGENDPVSKNGKQVYDVYNMYKDAGIKDIEMKLYLNGRHEMLNEINKEEVYSDVLNWLNKHLS